MKVLAVSDEEAKRFYDYYEHGMLDEYELIIGCGDLRREYLEFLVTMAKCPLIYVRGNHDDSYGDRPPSGCVCIENTVFEYNGIRFAGLGGSFRYRPDGKNMYTEFKMRIRILKMLPKIWFKKGFDVLVTHAPARNLGELDSVSHRGFECFEWLLKKYKPRYHLHGHIHTCYGARIQKVRQYEQTTIINVSEYYELDI